MMKEEGTKMTYEELENAYKEEVEWNNQLIEENKELKNFVSYVNGLKTKDDFLELRNIVLKANKIMKGKK